MTNTPQPLSREAISTAIKRKCVPLDGDGAAHIAHAITTHALESVLTGLRHEGKGCTFQRAFEVVFQRKLSKVSR